VPLKSTTGTLQGSTERRGVGEGARQSTPAGKKTGTAETKKGAAKPKPQKYGNKRKFPKWNGPECPWAGKRQSGEKNCSAIGQDNEPDEAETEWQDRGLLDRQKCGQQWETIYDGGPREGRGVRGREGANNMGTTGKYWTGPRSLNMLGTGKTGYTELMWNGTNKDVGRKKKNRTQTLENFGGPGKDSLPEKTRKTPR